MSNVMRKYCLLLLLFVTGCCSLKNNNEFCASVKDETPYVSYFKWHEVEALDPSKEKALELMLLKTKLMPTSCTQGIKFIRGGYGEGGWGWAEFSCKY